MQFVQQYMVHFPLQPTSHLMELAEAILFFLHIPNEAYIIGIKVRVKILTLILVTRHDK